MARVYPKDTYQKRNERYSFSIFLPLLDSNCWEFLGADHNDHGVDYAFEFIEDGEYKGYRILCQLKSRSKPEIRNGSIVFDFPVRTANYAIGCAQPFVFFFIDLRKEEVYYLSLQDYFISNKDKLDALDKNTSKIRVFIPMANKLDNSDLIEIAKSQYALDSKKGLMKTR